MPKTILHHPNICNYMLLLTNTNSLLLPEYVVLIYLAQHIYAFYYLLAY